MRRATNAFLLPRNIGFATPRAIVGKGVKGSSALVRIQEHGVPKPAHSEAAWRTVEGRGQMTETEERRDRSPSWH
jgi:hypothetical protein